MHVIRVRADHSKVDFDGTWRLWQRKAVAAEQALEEDAINYLFKVSGQRVRFQP